MQPSAEERCEMAERRTSLVRSDGGSRADTAVLVRGTRDSGLQPDHVNEPDFHTQDARLKMWQPMICVFDAGSGRSDSQTLMQQEREPRDANF